MERTIIYLTRCSPAAGAHWLDREAHYQYSFLIIAIEPPTLIPLRLRKAPSNLPYHMCFLRVILSRCRIFPHPWGRLLVSTPRIDFCRPPPLHDCKPLIGFRCTPTPLPTYDQVAVPHQDSTMFCSTKTSLTSASVFSCLPLTLSPSPTMSSLIPPTSSPIPGLYYELLGESIWTRTIYG